MTVWIKNPIATFDPDVGSVTDGGLVVQDLSLIHI